MRGLDNRWRKSSRSNNVGSCVEVRLADATIEVRDTKNLGDGPVLRFEADEWAAFTREIRGGGLSRA